MKRFLSLKSRDLVIVVSAAMFMAQLDGAVLAVALPELAGAFGVPAISLSLSITIYLIMLIALLPISGWAAERFGPRRIFLVAVVGFAFFSLMCALATSYWPFIFARAMQGAAASLLTPVGRLILLRQTPKDELVDALAITAMPMLIAPTLGPSLGGFIIDYARWEFIFLLNLPIAALLFALAWFRIPAWPPDRTLRFDMAGALLLAVTLICLLTGFDRLAGGIGRPLPWLLIAVGATLSWITYRHLRRHPKPILTFEPMRIGAFRTAAVGAGAAIRLPGRSMLFALPLLFQLAFGFSPFVAGLLLMALNGGDLLLKPLVGSAYERFGMRESVFWGSIAGLAALVVIALVPAGPWLVPILIAMLLISGMSRSIVFTGMSSLSFATLSKEQMASGNVLAGISMQLFNAVAISATAVMLGLSVQLGGRVEPVALDFRVTLLAVAVIGLIATFILRPQMPRDLKEIHPDDPV